MALAGNYYQALFSGQTQGLANILTKTSILNLTGRHFWEEWCTLVERGTESNPGSQ